MNKTNHVISCFTKIGTELGLDTQFVVDAMMKAENMDELADMFIREARRRGGKPH